MANTMGLTKDELLKLTRQTSEAYGLDFALVAAVVEQESSWNPWALRFEPAFYERYMKGITTISDTERHSRAFSWGLMQTMGQVCREFGFKGEFLSMLSDPTAGLDIGCRILKSKLASHPSSVESGLLSWNGGGSPDYGKQVLARVPNYSQLSA